MKTYRKLHDAICHAQRPCENMRIKFTQEIFDRSLTSKKPSAIDKEFILPSLEYSLTLLGSKAMIAETMKCGIHKKDEQKREIRKTFRLLPYIPSFPVIFKRATTAGILRRDHRGPTLGEVKSNLFGGYVFEKHDDFKKHIVTISNGKRDGLYVLKRGSTRITVDGGRGFNIVRIEHFLANGKIDFESIHDLNLHPNGIWFQSGYDMIRYADPASSREARYHRCVRVNDVQFDIKFDENAFELPESIDAIAMPSP